MPFIHLTNWLIKKKKCHETHQRNKNMPKKRVKGYIKCLPKQDSIEQIYGWLENEENERENFSYIEDYDDNHGDVNYRDMDNHLQTTLLKIRDIHPKKLLGKYLHGRFMNRFDTRKEHNIEARTNISMKNNINIVNRK